MSLKPLLLVLGLCVPLPAFAVSTITQQITRVLYDGSADYQYFEATAAWGATGCSSATYVQILPNVPGKQNMLAIVLAAYMAGKTVILQGICDANTNYFDATYVGVIG